nr:MAG TPA: hypothetical protein [Caudoviricetes sp.]
MPPKPDHEKRPFRFKLEGPFLRVSTMLLITPISPNFKGLKCSVFRRFRALQSRNIYGIIKTDEPRTLDFSGVRGFLVTNVCIVQRSAA